MVNAFSFAGMPHQKRSWNGLDTARSRAAIGMGSQLAVVTGAIVSFGDGGARGREAPSMCQDGNACRLMNALADVMIGGSDAIAIMVMLTGGSILAQTAQG